MDKRLQAQYGLKWNPFTQDVPVEALLLAPRIEDFCWRITNSLAREGGFALVAGQSGSGKSAVLRLLEQRLADLRDVRVGVLTRPQSGLPDFYRELGDLFGVGLSPHNRWAGTKLLRERWRAHVDAALYRPIVIIDEAQEMQPAVLNELRLLASVELDSRVLLTVVFAGDNRLLDKFRREDLLPLGSRIRVRLNLEASSSEQLAECLRHSLQAAGNPKLMTDELITTLADHAAGNNRILMNLASELLAAGVQREVERLDEKLYFEVFSRPPDTTVKSPAAANRTKRSRR
jgi:general secretion pathway protein A